MASISTPPIPAVNEGAGPDTGPASSGPMVCLVIGMAGSGRNK